MIESVGLYDMAAASGADPKARSFSRQEADILDNYRGSSLDALTSIHRQLAGLPPLGQASILASNACYQSLSATYSLV